MIKSLSFKRTLWGVMAMCFGLVAADQLAPPNRDWSFNGLFGTFKRDELQRGFQVYKEVCAACHSLKRIHFRNLEDLGFNEPEIKAIASEYMIQDGPNQDGEMFERKGLPSDKFPNPYPNDNAAKAVNNGALPPDLSLIVKARLHGADYIHGLLTGYEDAPEGVTVGEGQYYNKYMAGNLIAMAPPLLSEGQVTYADGTKSTIAQMAHDVTVFLAWAAEPEMEDRKRDGIIIMIYLSFMTVLFYIVMRRIWKDVK